MLLTTCPNCSAQFKVQPEQLNVRQGRVMCGRCRHVFNAFQSLTRVIESEDAEFESALEAMPVADEMSPTLTDSLFLREEPLPMSQDFSHTHFAYGIRVDDSPPPSPVSATSRAEDASAPGPGLLPERLPEPDDFLEDSPPPLPQLLLTETAASEASEAPEIPEVNAVAEAAEATEDNPLLSRAPVYQPRQGADRSRRWAWGAMLLLVGMTVQVAFAFRSVITQSYPQVRPSFVSICEWVGCNLSWGRDDSAIRIEASDLIETPGKAGHILQTATLVNRGDSRQDLPALELKLTDSANQVILSRILQPQEYLGRIPAKDDSLAPNVEVYINLGIELSNKAQASGYGVRAFYN
jgi:predicted Zn finger-like uncharacterized protein